jgi:hypothetical protein
LSLTTTHDAGNKRTHCTIILDTEQQETWTDNDKANLPLSHYKYEMILCSHNRASNTYFFKTFHILHFIYSPGTRVHGNGGGSVWSLKGNFFIEL